MIPGREAPTHGEAKNTSLTGTAAWNYAADTQWILGIRPEHDGLRVDPVLPGAWDGFTASRRFRGSLYRIQVRRGEAPGGRVRRLLVDGSAVEGNLVPAAAAGRIVEIEAVLEPKAAAEPAVRRG